MAKKPETLFRQRVQKALDALPNSWWESIQQRAIQGTPDIIGCLSGYFVAVEVKANMKSLATALQDFKLRKIADAHGLAFVVSPENFNETISVLKMIGEKHA